MYLATGTKQKSSICMQETSGLMDSTEHWTLELFCKSFRVVLFQTEKKTSQSETP